MQQAEIVRYAWGWARVTNYGAGRGSGFRSGYFAQDRAGGEGFGRTAEAALDQCRRPKIYKTRRAAEQAA